MIGKWLHSCHPTRLSAKSFRLVNINPRTSLLVVCRVKSVVFGSLKTCSNRRNTRQIGSSIIDLRCSCCPSSALLSRALSLEHARGLWIHHCCISAYTTVSIFCIAYKLMISHSYISKGRARRELDLICLLLCKI